MGVTKKADSNAVRRQGLDRDRGRLRPSYFGRSAVGCAPVPRTFTRPGWVLLLI